VPFGTKGKGINMNSRERLTRLFNNQEIDRVPIWLLAPFHSLTYYADIYNLPCYKNIVGHIDKYCDTFDRRHFNTGFCYNANPDIVTSDFEETVGGNVRSGKKTIYKDLEFTRYMQKGKDGTSVKYFVDDAEALASIINIPYTPIEPDVSVYFKEKEELGDRGLMMIDIGDPLGPLYNLMSAEDFSISTIIDYDKILEFTDEMYRRAYQLYKYVLERDVGEVFFIVGAEFAGPPLVSPAKFNDMSVRYVKGIVDLIRSYGKKSIVHYHGQLYHVLDGMKQINPDGLHTIEAPPVGDCTITQARAVLEDMILIGNIQYDDLARRNKQEIDLMVKQAIDEAKGGRFILSPTAGPYESELSDTMIENYIAFIEAGIKYGKY